MGYQSVGGIVDLNSGRVSDCCNLGVEAGNLFRAGIICKHAGGRLENSYFAGEFLFKEGQEPARVQEIYRDEGGFVVNCYSIPISGYKYEGVHFITLEEMLRPSFVEKLNYGEQFRMPIWKEDVNQINGGFPITAADESYAAGQCKIWPGIWLSSDGKEISANLSEKKYELEVICYYNASQPKITIENTSIAEISRDGRYWEITLKKAGTTHINIHLDASEHTNSVDYTLSLKISDDTLSSGDKNETSPKNISKAALTLEKKNYTYDGKAKKPAVTVVLDGKTLKKDTDYQTAYSNNVKAGTATVTVTGKGNYTGTVKTTFTIQSPKKTKKSISKAAVSLKKSSYAYDGKAKKPAVTVKLGKTTLKASRDYTVSYKGNKNIGKATVTVTGKGNYTGKVSKTFTIAAKKGTSFTVSGNKYKILNAAQVSFTGIKNTKATKAVIPATVKIGGKTFKVTSVAANALNNKAKVTSVTVGTNVTAIGSNAFYGCKKLGTVTIKSAKLKTIGKNAFKGIKSTAKIKVPKAKERTYKKLLKGKGQGKKVKIVRI